MRRWCLPFFDVEPAGGGCVGADLDPAGGRLVDDVVVLRPCYRKDLVRRYRNFDGVSRQCDSVSEPIVSCSARTRCFMYRTVAVVFS